MSEKFAFFSLLDDITLHFKKEKQEASIFYVAWDVRGFSFFFWEGGWGTTFSYSFWKISFFFRGRPPIFRKLFGWVWKFLSILLKNPLTLHLLLKMEATWIDLIIWHYSKSWYLINFLIFCLIFWSFSFELYFNAKVFVENFRSFFGPDSNLCRCYFDLVVSDTYFYLFFHSSYLQMQGV